MYSVLTVSSNNFFYKSELKEILYAPSCVQPTKPDPDLYHLAAAIVANMPTQIKDVTWHDTATGQVYVWAVWNCVSGPYFVRKR